MLVKAEAWSHEKASTQAPWTRMAPWLSWPYRRFPQHRPAAPVPADLASAAVALRLLRPVRFLSDLIG